MTIDAAMDTIKPMTEEERQASKQREEANMPMKKKGKKKGGRRG